MKIKLICSDIDGTLLNKDRRLSEKTISEIKRKYKTPFILISSRMPKAIVHLQKDLGITSLPSIAYNGGLIIGNEEILFSAEIRNSITHKIADFCKQTNLHISLYHNNEWYVPCLDFWAKREWNNTKVEPAIQDIKTTLKKWTIEDKGAHKIMIMGKKEEIDNLEIYINSNLQDKIIAYRSKPSYLEVADRSISKKTAIEELLKQKYPSLSLENILAFGDNYNDIEMLKAVGLGVAVANAKPEVLSISDIITDTNKEDGVANYLEGIETY